ncbi:MAG: histidine decarboxylase [Chloroflexi bacterium]|nr:histidine decarboxylase [Chloroflexota bacterium]
MNNLTQESKLRLAALEELYREASAHALGYPVNLTFDYKEILPFLDYNANNVGDPFHGTNYRINSHDFERDVIARFAGFMRIDPEDAWGYVTTGGTEGNMYGLYMARELHPNGVVYFSQDTHYSILKILRVLNMRNIMIKSQENGEIDYDDLRETIRINRDVPVIFMANIGTTMKGAVDDLRQVRNILDDLAVTQSYIHSDAALSGMILPFVSDPQPFGFDEGADSLAVSGHKLIGSPIPCGVVLTRKEYVARISRSVEYVGVMDTTLPGSRNAWTPLLLWYALERHGEEGFRQVVGRMLSLADYAVERFNESGISAWRNPNSVTVVFPRPSSDVIGKWQLAPYRDIAHLITMPHVTREMVDELVDECLESERVQLAR